MDRAATKTQARLAAQGGREAKLQRLNSLRRDCPYASKSALQAILSNVKTNGLPDLMSSKNMTEATRAQLSKNNLYGPLMQQVRAVGTSGETVQLWLVNGLSLLAASFAQGGSWASMLQNTHGSNPSSHTRPWDLVLYADEVVPGNCIAHRLASNLQPAWSCSFFVLLSHSTGCSQSCRGLSRRGKFG